MGAVVILGGADRRRGGGVVRRAGPATTGGPKGEPIKVGVLYSLTGTLSVHEKPILHATQLAVDEINEAGGVLGRPVEPISPNGDSDEETFAEKAASLIEEEKVEVLFGCWTSSSAASASRRCARSTTGCCSSRRPTRGWRSRRTSSTWAARPTRRSCRWSSGPTPTCASGGSSCVGSEDVYSRAVNAILEHEIKQLGAKVVGERYLLVGDDGLRAAVAEEIKRRRPT